MGLGASSSAAVGTPAASMTSFAKDLEPRSAPPRRPGRRPRRRQRRMSRAPRRAVPPARRRRGRSRADGIARAAPRSRPACGMAGAEPAMPGPLGGVEVAPAPRSKRSSTRACSRPPEPTMRTFTRASSIARRMSCVTSVTTRASLATVRHPWERSSPIAWGPEGGQRPAPRARGLNGARPRLRGSRTG